MGGFFLQNDVFNTGAFQFFPESAGAAQRTFGLSIDVINSNQVQLNALGTTQMFYADHMINLTHKLGIGTSSPATPIHIWESDANTTVTTGNADAIRITNPSTANNTMGELDFTSVDATAGAELRTSGILGLTTSHTQGSMSGALAFVTRNAGTYSERMRLTSAASVGIGTTTPIADFQATDAGANSTTTVELGKTGQNKGSCLKLYRTDGSAIYAYVAAGATSFTLTTATCASVVNF